MNTRTNIVLDDELVAQAMARARVTTKKAAVEAALRAYVRQPDYSGLLALAGTGVIAEGYDPKAQSGHSEYSHVAEPAPTYVPTRVQAAKASPAKPRPAKTSSRASKKSA